MPSSENKFERLTGTRTLVRRRVFYYKLKCAFRLLKTPFDELEKLSQFSRCNAGFAAKVMREMRGRGKAEQISNFGDAHIGAFE